MKILTEIQNRISKETRPLEDLTVEIKKLGFQMMVTNAIGKEQVVMFCSDMIKLYEGLVQDKPIKLTEEGT